MNEEGKSEYSEIYYTCINKAKGTVPFDSISQTRGKTSSVTNFPAITFYLLYTDESRPVNIMLREDRKKTRARHYMLSASN